MKRTILKLNRLLGGIALCISLSCTRIDVFPTCPNQLDAGGEGPVAANPIMPGAVPTYSWEVVPAEAGEFDDPAAPNTIFRALLPGEAVIRLTASDSLFLAEGECRTIVGSPAETVSVSLTIDPLLVVAGTPVRLVCTSTGATPVSTFDIRQTSGVAVTLTPSTEGVFLFTPDTADVLTFQCSGNSASGSVSNTTALTVTVQPAADEDEDPTRPPSRTGRR